jgi:hypothetical protein
MSTRLFGRIDSPCEVDWESLEGEGAVRYCGQCKLNVHNFSEMTAEEVEQVMADSEGRLCARIRTRPDGSLYTDNCPYPLRRIRDRIRRAAPWAFIFIAFLFGQSVADAQGLVGLPVEGRFGQSTDTRYYNACCLNEFVRSLASGIAVMVLAIRNVKDCLTINLLKNRLGICRADTGKAVCNRVVQVALLLLAPAIIYIIGMIIIARRPGEW